MYKINNILHKYIHIYKIYSIILQKTIMYVINIQKYVIKNYLNTGRERTLENRMKKKLHNIYKCTRDYRADFLQE